jgi:thymidylate kinase
VIVALEGLPGAGKTSTISTLTGMLSLPHVPEMLVTPDIEAGFTATDYSEHDRRKIALASRLGTAGICLMDRSPLSNEAFRYASEGGTPPTLAIDDNTGLSIPDHYLYLRISPRTSMQRRLQHSNRWNGFQFATRLVEFYDHFRDQTPDKVSTVDAEQPYDQVIETAVDLISQLARNNQPPAVTK